MIEDETLVKRFLAGMSEAWKRLVARYRSAVIGVVVGMKNLRAEHLKQLAPNAPPEAFFNRLFDDAAAELKDLGMMSEDFNFAIWLYRFVLKRLQQKGPRPLSLTHFLKPFRGAGFPEVPDFIKEGAVLEALVLLGKRYPLYQKTIVLKIYGKRWHPREGKLVDLSYEEIGKILGNPDPINPDCVKNWYHRGMERLEKILQGDYDV